MGGGPEHTDRKNIDYTNYEEGIYVGYRYFDTFGVPVSYPFGYGQSYTTFNYSSLKVFMGDTDYSISCTITNNGGTIGGDAILEEPKPDPEQLAVIIQMAQAAVPNPENMKLDEKETEDME